MVTGDKVNRHSIITSLLQQQVIQLILKEEIVPPDHGD